MVTITKYGYIINCGGSVIPVRCSGTYEEKMARATAHIGAIRSAVNTEPLPVLSETDEAILNTNANVEYLVALKELEV